MTAPVQGAKPLSRATRWATTDHLLFTASTAGTYMRPHATIILHTRDAFLRTARKRSTPAEPEQKLWTLRTRTAKVRCFASGTGDRRHVLSPACSHYLCRRYFSNYYDTINMNRKGSLWQCLKQLLSDDRDRLPYRWATNATLVRITKLVSVTVSNWPQSTENTARILSYS